MGEGVYSSFFPLRNKEIFATYRNWETYTHTYTQMRKRTETHVPNSRHKINSLASIQNTHVRARKYTHTAPEMQKT